MTSIRTEDPFLEREDSSYAPSETRRLSARSKTRPYPFSSSNYDDDVFLPHKRQRHSENGESSDNTVSSTGSVQLALIPSSKSIFVGPMTICGVRLRPTVAFDTFWRFAAERKAIDDRRRAGEPAP